MTEVWQWFLAIGSGIVFIVLVLDALVRFYKYLKNGKKSAEEIFAAQVKKVIEEDRKVSCPFLMNVKNDNEIRSRELLLLREAIVAELQPIKDDLTAIKDLNTKLHHSQMTDLQIKLGHLYHNKFDKSGTLSKSDQTNWDKWYSDYFALGGNSDIKRMDDLIQATRVAVTLGKANKSKKEKEGEANEN